MKVLADSFSGTSRTKYPFEFKQIELDKSCELYGLSAFLVWGLGMRGADRLHLLDLRSCELEMGTTVARVL